VAQALAPIRAPVRGFDWTASPLLLLVAPATDNYVLDPVRDLELLPDGTGRLAVGHRHEKRTYVRAPSIVVRWALYRATGPGCPSAIALKDGDRTLPATSVD